MEDDPNGVAGNTGYMILVCALSVICLIAALLLTASIVKILCSRPENRDSYTVFTVFFLDLTMLFRGFMFLTMLQDPKQPEPPTPPGRTFSLSDDEAYDALLWSCRRVLWSALPYVFFLAAALVNITRWGQILHMLKLSFNESEPFCGCPCKFALSISLVVLLSLSGTMVAVNCPTPETYTDEMDAFNDACEIVLFVLHLFVAMLYIAMMAALLLFLMNHVMILYVRMRRQILVVSVLNSLLLVSRGALFFTIYRNTPHVLREMGIIEKVLLIVTDIIPVAIVLFSVYMTRPESRIASNFTSGRLYPSNEMIRLIESGEFSAIEPTNSSRQVR